MNRAFQILLVLMILFVVYYVYVEVFLSDIVITILFFSMFALASIFYKAMIEA